MLEEMMPRWVPTENVNGFEICPGLYRDEGATAFQSAVNFTVHSKGAVTCELLLFHRKEPEPYAVIPFPENCRIGDVFSMMVFGLDIEEFEYAYRLDGPWKPKEGLLFDKKHILLDPYAKAVTGQSVWGKALNTGGYRARVVRNNFFWGSEKPDKIPMEKLIIYEMHVRGFTKMDKSVRHPGTFAGIKEKIPYLKTLGINAVELMPIFEFDELQGSREVDGKKLIDYWGYNTVSFFAPNTSYATSTEYNREGVELKELIRELHDKKGMTIILVSHSMEDIARYADRLIVMNSGEVMYNDTPKNVFAHYQELEKVGLAAPQVTYIMHDLKMKGFPVGVTATTVEEAADEIMHALGRQ